MKRIIPLLFVMLLAILGLAVLHYQVAGCYSFALLKLHPLDIPPPLQVWFLKNPRPVQEVPRRIIAWMSAIASPGAEMVLLTPLLSIPWPHSWSKIAAISPVFRHCTLSR